MRRSETGLVAVALACLLGWTVADFRGPLPVPQNAPGGRFSAERAIGILERTLHGVPAHPVGSPANREVRDRITARFKELRYSTAIERDFVCNATPSCATVENIIATVPGDPGPYVVLASHYDSVAAGPGVSDAGVAVAAILETARALAGRRGVAYLITDGEEAGLLGAEAFVKTAMKDRVSVIVNAENRGTSGPAFLFETSRGNAALLPAIRQIDRPNASSLFYTIYEMLPNDTDVTVFKRAGLQALNFGAIGNVEYYHTPLDDLAHVNARTMQHHGDNLLSVTRALLRGVGRSESNAVFFNVFSFGVVAWPERWTLWIAIASLVVLLASAFGTSWKGVAIGAATTLFSVAVAAALAFAVILLAHARAGDATRLAYPHPVVAAAWFAGIAGTLSSFSAIRRQDLRALQAGVGLVWHSAAIALALHLPGTAYLALVPAVAIALSLRMRPLFAASIPALACAVFMFPLALFLYPALGKTSLMPIAVIVALAFTCFAALVERKLLLRGSIAATVLAVAGAAATIALPVYTPDHPRRDPIEHELPEPSVEATTTRQGSVATISVKSSRRADRLMLAFDEETSGVEVLRVNGVAPAPPNPGRVRRSGVTVYAPDAIVEVRAPRGTEVTVSDLTYGVPAGTRERAKNAVTTHRGDVTISRTKLRL